MSESAINTKISEKYGIDATDAVKDAVLQVREEHGIEADEEFTSREWAEAEAYADVYAADYLDEMAGDHLAECEECQETQASTSDALRHIHFGDGDPKVGEVETQRDADIAELDD